MNISCISCPARYGVPDAKVVGKRVRITCKRCGTVLLVDGTVNPPRIVSGANAGPSVVPVPRTSLPPASSPPLQPAPKPSVEFLVVMPDDRQETADVAQIVRLYRDRQINAETLVWCEGMDEWKAVWDVEEIGAAFRRMGYARPSQPTARPSQPAQASYDDSADDASTHVVPSSHPPAAVGFDEDEATSVVDSSRIPFEPPVGGYGRAEREDDDPTGVMRSPMDLAFAPDVARRASVEKRSDRQAQRTTSTSERPVQRAVRAEPTPSPEPAQVRQASRARAQRRERQQGLDLFAAEAQRQAQQELAPAVEDDGARLTGARGENSVLFSLDALVRQEQQQQRPLVLPPRARTDESVLVDSSPSLPSGVAGSALIAPDFTAPVSAPPPRMATAMEDIEYPAPKKGGGWLLPAGVILVAGAAVGGWMSGKLQPLLKAAGVPVSVPSAETAASAAKESSAAAKPSAEGAESAEPEASAAPSASASASAAPSASAVAHATTPKPQTPREPGTATPKASSEKASGETETPKEATAKPSGGGEFDTASAKTALTAAANNASSCREATGPMGSGKVSITFAASGRPTSVAVTGDLAGTSVGSCVARLFRAVRVPPFSGDPVSVSKAFSVK